MTIVTPARLVGIELSPARRRELSARTQEIVTIDWFHTRIAACFDQPCEAESFRRRYQSFITHDAADMRSRAVRNGNEDGEPILWTEPGKAYRYPAVLHQAGTIAFLVDAVTQSAFFDVNPKITSFHAAALRVGECAAAISATSAGGKSTTALACVRRNMELYSDERCIVIDGHVHAFPRAINVRKGGLELLASEEVAADGGIAQRLQAHRGADWESASFSDLIGDRPLPQPARLEAIFFIDGRDNAASVKPLPREGAIVRLLTAGFCGPKPGLERVAAATAICQQARAYALTLGSPDDTALLVAATTQRAESVASVAS